MALGFAARVVRNITTRHMKICLDGAIILGDQGRDLRISVCKPFDSPHFAIRSQDLDKHPIEALMRVFYVFLLLVALILATTDAVSTSDQVKALEIVTSDSIATNEHDAPAKRFLRKRSMAEKAEDEERGFPSLAKQFGGKLKRLAKYNKWIFSGKKPQDLKSPGGYWNFYHNRMTPGGKYARRLADKQ
jgi:hypothetical protein